MAVRTDVRPSDHWFHEEDKKLRFTDDASDITLWAIQYTLYRGETEDPIFTAKTVGSGITIVDGPSGVLEVQIDATDILIADAEATHHFELMRTNAGSVTILAYGDVYIR